jgi:uncharacterized protein (TIGR00369 family)
MPNESYFAAVRRPDQEVNQLFKLFGARLGQAQDGTAEIALPISARLTPGAGRIAGGVLAALADEAMAHAVMSMVEENERLVTVEMNIRYLRAADPGAAGDITAQGAVIKRGRAVVFAEARISGPDGKLLAVAGGSFTVSPVLGKNPA